MILKLSQSTMLMLLLAAVLPFVAEAIVTHNDMAVISQHISCQDALHWGIHIVPEAAEADGSAVPLYAREAFLLANAPGAQISVPNLLTWAEHPGERPVVDFKERHDLGSPYVDHNPFTGRWTVLLPGVLDEKRGASSDEEVALARAKIGYKDGKFHLDSLSFHID